MRTIAKKKNKQLRYKNSKVQTERKPIITVEELLKHKDKEFKDLEDFVKEYKAKQKQRKEGGD